MGCPNINENLILAEILGDPYSKKSPLQSIGNFLHLANSPRLSLAMCLCISTSYTSAARYPTDNCDIINIGLRILKLCGMYAKEFKNLILRKNIVP
jgi:hypothetical protein